MFDDPAFDGSAFDDPRFDGAGFGGAGFDSAGFGGAGFDSAGFGGAGFDSAGFDHAGVEGAGFEGTAFGASGPGSAAFGDPIFGDYPPGTSPLAALDDRFSRRLPELAFEPGLVAAVDQHSAAIRDAVYEPTHGHEHASLREALTDYVLGFTDALREMGWHSHEGYDFATLRLTAVCHFMREYGLNAAE